MKKEVTTLAMVVGRHASGEGSSRVVLYTEELGRITAFARSGREERSKLRPHLVVGARGSYDLVKGKSEWRVTGAVHTENIFYSCQEDDARTSAARTFTLLRSLVHGEGKDERLFTALHEYCVALPTLTGDSVRIAEYVVALNILAALGYVEEEPVTDLIDARYTAALLKNAADKRRALIRAINEGIAASQLVS
ncbi:MAG: recombination protein O N-terminal domain-containing protein [Patescibacteria group bacterium]